MIIEAASQGTPSVVYNVAGLRDSVKNGKTGIVLKENNCKEMAERQSIFTKTKKDISFSKRMGWFGRKA